MRGLHSWKRTLAGGVPGCRSGAAAAAQATATEINPEYESAPRRSAFCAGRVFSMPPVHELYCHSLRTSPTLFTIHFSSPSVFLVQVSLRCLISVASQPLFVYALRCDTPLMGARQNYQHFSMLAKAWAAWRGPLPGPRPAQGFSDLTLTVLCPSCSASRLLPVCRFSRHHLPARHPSCLLPSSLSKLVPNNR